MNLKNKKSKRTFIPQKFGDTLKKINRNFSSKYGRLEFIIQSKWPEIVGLYFVDFSEPKNISKITSYEGEFGENIYKNTLNVSVAPSAALEFQHYKDTILEKINSFFGYKAIIDLRIHQNYIPKRGYKELNKNTKKLTVNEKKDISDGVEIMTNKDLKKSLFDLGKNIIKESKK